MSDFIAGIGYFGRGLVWVARRPRQWGFGLIPALIVLAVYTAGFVTLAYYDWGLAIAVTSFADDWGEEVRDATRLLVAALIFGVAVFLAIVTFTGVTLAVGAPFYEKLAWRVEESEGGAPPEPDVPLVRQVLRGLADAVVVGVLAGLFGVLFFVLGFVPAVGQTVVPVLAGAVSGYFLTLELTGMALERRGWRRRDRLAALRRNRLLSVGFGASVFVVFLLPLGAVVAMPGAVAGGTLLARQRLAGPGGPGAPVATEAT